jgi:type IV pilus assembly protein PilM
MFLRNPFAGAFGLDIGDLSIKLVKLKRQHLPRQAVNYIIEEMRTINLPPGYIVDGEIQQPEMVRKKILQLLGKDGGKYKPIKTPWVVADLPEPQTFLKTILIEARPEELTEEDILYQARKHLPFDLSEAYLDWQVTNLGKEEKISKIIIGAVPKTVSDSYTYLLESAELQPIALEIEAASIARALVTAEKDYTGEARAILDLGATRSSLIIYDHDTIQFSTNINFSGEIITTAIMQELKIDYPAAEKMKIENGLMYNKTKPRYLKTVTELTDKLVDEIKSAINFYQEHFPEPNPITHITMTGGVANLKNLGETISRKLKISSNPGNTWKNLKLEKVDDNFKNVGMLYSSAVGLALRAAQKPW